MNFGDLSAAQGHTLDLPNLGSLLFCSLRLTRTSDSSHHHLPCRPPPTSLFYCYTRRQTDGLLGTTCHPKP